MKNFGLIVALLGGAMCASQPVLAQSLDNVTELKFEDYNEELRLDSRPVGRCDVRQPASFGAIA